MEKVDRKTKQRFEQERPNHEHAQRNEKARRGVDAKRDDGFVCRLQGWVRLNRFRPNNQADDWNHNREPQNLDDAVDDDAQQQKQRALSFLGVEKPESPLKDAWDGVGFRHVVWSSS